MPGVLESRDASKSGNSNKNKTEDTLINGNDAGTLTIILPTKLKRKGLETKLVIDADGSGAHNHLALKVTDSYLHQLSTRKLKAPPKMPNCWREQRRLLEFD